MLKRFVMLLLAVSMMFTLTPAMADIEYPLDTDAELTIWMPISSSVTNKISSYVENESFQYAQTATGVKLNFIHPSNATLAEEFNLMIVSGDLPDIIVNPMYLTSSANATACVNGVEDGLFLDLTDLIEENSPVYYSYLRDNKEFFQDATTPEGRVYYYTNYKNVTSDVEGSWDRFQVRKDWLEEIELDTLRTVADYEKYFQHILDTKEGVTPFTLVKNGIERCFLTAYDISGDGFFHIDGQVKYGAYMRVSDPEQEIHDFYYLRPANGQYAVITSDCKYVKEAMEFMDYGYTVDGSYTYCYGVPGVAWNYGDDGLPKYTDYVLNNTFGYTMTEVSYILRFHEGFPHMRDSDALSIPSNAKDPGCLAYRLQWQDDPHCNYDRVLPSNLSMTNEESIRRSEIMAEVETYRDEMVLKYITGVESLDSFEQYQQTMKDLGIDEAIELTQNGYDALLSKVMAE